MAEVKSLADELGEAFDAAEKEDVSHETINSSDAEIPAKEPEKADSADREIPIEAKLEKPVETEKTDTTKPAEPAKTDTDKPLESEDTVTAKQLNTPPATWSAGAKAIFASLPETARKEIAKREQDFARGIQQHAEAAKGYQSLMAEFQPYEAMIRAENGTPQGAIRELLKTSYLLRTGTSQDRGNLIMQIAQRFGADLTPYLGQKQENNDQLQQTVQQLVNPYLQKIQSFEESQRQAQVAQEQQIQNEVGSQLEVFQNAVEEDGITPKHLYFENVRGLMSTYFANGQAKTLEQAYDMACWATPEVRATLIANQQKVEEAQRLEAAKRKTAEAKKSGFNVNGQGGAGLSGSNVTSLRDEISSLYDAGNRI